MPFSLSHKVCTYLIALTAIAAVVLSGEISALAIVLSVGAVALSWWAEPPRYPLERFVTAWNVAALLFLSYLTVRVVRGEAIVIAGVHFLLFVLVNKLFNRRTSKDYQHVYVLTFLLIIAATTLNVGMSYAICLVLYVIIATWSLILLHLRREIEDSYLLKHSGEKESEKVEARRILNSRRIVGPRFFLGTSALSLAMVGGAALIFMLFPRLGFGLFSGPRRHGIAMVGFSERVQLGHHGTIQDNPQVVMRVTFGAPGRREPAPRAPLRWRGSVFDQYEDGAWSHSPDLVGRTVAVQPRERLYGMGYAPGMPLSSTPTYVRSQTLRQQIYLEPLETSLIFAADRPVALEVPRSRVAQIRPFVPRRGPLGEVRASHRRTAGVRYIAYSKLYRLDPERLRQAEPVTKDRLRRFLQLPASLPARVFELAERITAGKTSPYDKAIAVQRYLEQNYRYTVDLERVPGRDPVEAFLFVTRAGHCEYFASAMALLLRAVGVHTRHVNGFAGGRWNDYGQYLAVRQSDAHAWTEVLLSNIGWVSFDPTPAPGRVKQPEPGLADTVGQMIDALRLRWFGYVIEYDLHKQLTLFTAVRQAFASKPSPVQRPNWPTRLRKEIVVSLAGLLIAALLVWRLSRRRRARQPAGTGSSGLRRHPATALYRKGLRLLERSNAVKPCSTTPREFALQLLQQGHPWADTVDHLTRRYYTARFANAHWTAQESHELSALLTELRRQLAHVR